MSSEYIPPPDATPEAPFGYRADGTPRLRRKRRSREEVGGDPKASRNRYDKLFAVPIERREFQMFEEFREVAGMTRKELVRRAILEFIARQREGEDGRKQEGEAAPAEPGLAATG